MKYIRYIFIFVIWIISFTVYADTCSYKEQTILNNDFSNVKITYEVVNNEEIDILIYNLTDNIYVSYNESLSKEENSIYYYNTDNGKYVIKRDTSNIEEYQFKIRSNISSCYGNVLTTKNIIKPKYNEYSTLSICDNEKLKNHSYCQKYITSNINKSESEVISTLEEFLSVRVGQMTTVPTKKENKVDIKTIVTYSSISLIVIVLVVILLLIKKKRGEL